MSGIDRCGGGEMNALARFGGVSRGTPDPEVAR